MAGVILLEEEKMEKTEKRYFFFEFYWICFYIYSACGFRYQMLPDRHAGVFRKKYAL